MISLFLTLVLNGTVTQTNKIDNVTFDSVKACEVYKARMSYKNSSHLKFTCK